MSTETKVEWTLTEETRTEQSEVRRMNDEHQGREPSADLTDQEAASIAAFPFKDIQKESGHLRARVNGGDWMTPREALDRMIAGPHEAELRRTPGYAIFASLLGGDE